MTTKEKIDALAELFRLGKAAADEAGKDEEDGGTCNHDCPAIRVPGMRHTAIEQAAALAGVTVTDFTWMGGQRWYWVNPGIVGQGNRRARMSTAADRAMKAAAPEWCRVCEYCAMD